MQRTWFPADILQIIYVGKSRGSRMGPWLVWDAAVESEGHNHSDGINRKLPTQSDLTNHSF